MKKRWIFIVCVIVLIVIAVWSAYKCVLINRFPFANDANIVKTTKDVQELTIKTDRSLANEEYDGLNIYIPDGIVKYEDNRDFEHAIYVSVLNSAPIRISIRKYRRWIDTVQESGIDNMKYDYISLLEDYDISHELELLDYYKDHLNEKRTIFTSTKHIMMDHVAESYSRDLWGYYKNNLEYNRILTGDLTGVIFKNQERFYIAKVYNGDHVYEIWIYDFEDSEKDKIINSIYFE